MKSTLVLHPDMGAAVVKRLREFGNLPKGGILAGQAVDSALTDLYGMGGGVYNDVDIFRNVPGGSPRKASAVNTTARSTVSVHAAENYGTMSVVLEMVQTYSIKSVSRRDMLNFINCNMASGHMRDKLTAEQVIAGFDLNCTRVAVDLATNRLVWDAAYEDFVRSRQLRIAMMHTPWHTFLRLLKKRQELPNVFVDVEAAAQACTGVAQSKYLADMLQGRDISMRFGKKHQELAMSLTSDWEPYFSLEEKVVRQVGQGSFWSDAPEDNRGHQGDLTLWHMTPRASLDAALQARLNKFNRAVVVYGPRVVEDSRRARSSSALRKLENVKAQRLEDVGRLVDRDFVTFCADIFDTAYVQGQALPSVATKVGNWLKKHTAFSKPLFGLTLAQQWQAIGELEQVCRDYEAEDPQVSAIQALGVLETQAKPEDLKSRERMLALLREDTRKGREPFKVTPLPMPRVLPRKFAGFAAQELLNPLALRLEGLEMHHCVGGYSERVRGGRCRILSIRHPGKPHTWSSTVELVGNFSSLDHPTLKQLELGVAQNRIRENKVPSTENNEFVAFLVAYMQVVAEVEAIMGLSETQRAGAVNQRLAQAQAEVAQHTEAVRTAARYLHKNESRKLLQWCQALCDVLSAYAEDLSHSEDQTVELLAA
jgi:hypothetical protein